MADDIDLLLATPVAQTPTTPVPTAQPGQAPVNYRPREYTDEDLGIATGPIGPSAKYMRVHDPIHAPDAPLIREDPVMDVATAMAGGAAGKLARTAIGKVAPTVGRYAEPAVASAATAALQGANPKQTGVAGLAGLVLGAPLAYLGGAPERVRERAMSLQDIVQGEGDTAKPAKSLARKLAARAGDEGQNLAQALGQDPELEGKLSTTVARHPREALGAVQEALDRHKEATTPAYQAITDAGGVKLTDITGPMQKLKDSYLEGGNTPAAEAVDREIKSLASNYGGQQAENATLSGKQLQGLRNQIGQAAFESTPMASRALKTQVKRDLYGAYRDAIEGAVSTLEGVAPVDLKRFRAHNKATSVLLPLKDVLQDRAESEATGAKSLAGRAMDFVGGEGAKPGALLLLALRKGLTPDALKEAAIEYAATKAIPAVGRGLAQGGRVLDAALARAGGTGSAASAVGLPVAGAARAINESPGGKLLNGVRVLGRPATAQERTAAGLPASLAHALDANDPNLGHAALVHEVFGQ